MFCKHCGNEIDDNAYVCLKCGAKVGEDEKPKQGDGSALGVVGLCFALFIPLVTFICSGIGLNRAYRTNTKSSKILNFIALAAAIGMFIYNLTNIDEMYDILY